MAAATSYATEWVWLLSTYDTQIELLTRSMNDKYRARLGLVSDLSSEDWSGMSEEQFASANPASANLPDAARCFAAAKAEFSSRKKRLDDAFVKSFSDWSAVAYAKNPEAASAVWQAVKDLRTLRGQWFGSTQPGEKALNIRAELAKETSGRIKELLKTKSKSLEKLIDTKMANLPDVVRAKIKKAVGGGIDKFSDYLNGQLSDVMAVRDPAQLDKAIEALTLWGDAVLDAVAYPVSRRPALYPQPKGAPEPDYFGLGGGMYTYTREGWEKVEVPKAVEYITELPFYKPYAEQRHYNTAFAISWNKEHVLYREFGAHTVTVVQRRGVELPQVLGTVTLDSLDMAKLRAGQTIEKQPNENPNAPFPLRFDKRGVDTDDYLPLDEQYRKLDEKFTAMGKEGEKLWFAQVMGPDKAKSAAAIRLLKADLEEITAEWDLEKASNELWKYGLTFLADKLAKLPKALSPLSGVVDYYRDQFSDYLTKDARTPFIQQLDEKSIDVASQIAGTPHIRPVLPNREADLQRMLALSPKLPSFCGTEVAAPAPAPQAPAPAAPDYAGWAGTWVGTVEEGTGTVQISVSGQTITATDTWIASNDGKPAPHRSVGKWAPCQLNGAQLSCQWTSAYTDADKDMARHGTLIAVRSGDSMAVTATEGKPTATWRVPEYSSKMQEGTVWNNSYARQR